MAPRAVIAYVFVKKLVDIFELTDPQLWVCTSPAPSLGII